MFVVRREGPIEDGDTKGGEFSWLESAEFGEGFTTDDCKDCVLCVCFEDERFIADNRERS